MFFGLLMAGKFTLKCDTAAGGVMLGKTNNINGG
jgi:hypothetical protein